jgi:hypothetical protein
METPIRKRSELPRASRSRKAAAQAGRHPVRRGGRAVIEIQPQRFLLGVARQSGIGDPDSCRIILALLSASRAIHRTLGRELGFQDNAGCRFATLATLYALSPSPVTAADLASHAEVSWSTIMGVIEGLQRCRLVTRAAPGRDRVAPIYLTGLGQQVAVLAVRRFLQVARDLAGDLGAPLRKSMVEACRKIESRATNPASPCRIVSSLERRLSANLAPARKAR